MTATDEEDPTVLAGEVMRLLGGSSAAPLPRHRHSLTRDDVRKDQTARIMAAAIDLFAGQGYARTTIAEITKKAGVSRKTFYELYDDKEDVFLDTYKAVNTLIQAIGLGAEEPIALTLETLPQYLERAMSFMSLTPAATRMFFIEALGAGPRVRARRNGSFTEVTAAVTPALQLMRATLEPALPPLEYELCRAVIAAAGELIVEHIVSDGPETLPALVPELTLLVIAVVAPNHASPVTPRSQPSR